MQVTIYPCVNYYCYFVYRSPSSPCLRSLLIYSTGPKERRRSRRPKTTLFDVFLRRRRGISEEMRRTATVQSRPIPSPYVSVSSDDTAGGSAVECVCKDHTSKIIFSLDSSLSGFCLSISRPHIVVRCLLHAGPRLSFFCVPRPDQEPPSALDRWPPQLEIYLTPLLWLYL